MGGRNQYECGGNAERAGIHARHKPDDDGLDVCARRPGCLLAQGGDGRGAPAKHRRVGASADQVSGEGKIGGKKTRTQGGMWRICPSQVKKFRRFH